MPEEIVETVVENKLEVPVTEKVVEIPVTTTEKTGEEQPPVTPVKVEEPKMVPLAAAQDERKKRKILEKENIEIGKQAAYYRGLAEGAKASQPITPTVTATPIAPVAPKQEDFQDWDKYEAAKAKYDDARLDYVQKKTAFDIDQKYAAEIAREKEERSRREMLQGYNQRMTVAIAQDAELPHIAEVIGNSIPAPMQEAILGSDAAPQFIRYLYDNPDEKTRLRNLSGVALFKEMGKIEYKLLNPPKEEIKKISTAAPPAEELQTSNVVTEIDLDKTDMKTYVAERRKADLLKRGRGR